MATREQDIVLKQLQEIDFQMESLLASINDLETSWRDGDSALFIGDDSRIEYDNEKGTLGTTEFSESTIHSAVSKAFAIRDAMGVPVTGLRTIPPKVG